MKLGSKIPVQSLSCISEDALIERAGERKHHLTLEISERCKYGGSAEEEGGQISHKRR